MMAISSDLIEKVMEVFKDDFSIHSKTFTDCLANLGKVLRRCQEDDLVLNWEKCHFMVREGIVLGHKISEKGIHSFLGYARFYRRFIYNFSQIA
jgi:hypothetical protein